MSEETTKERVQRLVGEAFATETGGGTCTWDHYGITDVYTLHNPQANLAMKLDRKALIDLVHEVDEAEWNGRLVNRRLVRFERVGSGRPEAVYE